MFALYDVRFFRTLYVCCTPSVLLYVGIFAIITNDKHSKALLRIAPTYLPLLVEPSLKYTLFAYVARQRIPHMLPHMHLHAKFPSCPSFTLTQTALHHRHVEPTCQIHLQPQAPPWTVLGGHRRPSPVTGASADGPLPMVGLPSSPWLTVPGSRRQPRPHGVSWRSACRIPPPAPGSRLRQRPLGTTVARIHTVSTRV
jgi:hypothetical protein